uniref:Uncharacterized protein n=1 Tax=Tanacetum cinerariifolium TaxID=118510 RepID=A0A699KEK4_TANCI|nr:hypothetical protein [Tanacetum cinerariifolium]
MRLRTPTQRIPHQVLSLKGQRPLTLDFNTFCSLIVLDYNNGKYVDHPTPEAVKKELVKIAINPSYLDKTPFLKNSFHVAWRILFTFVIQEHHKEAAVSYADLKASIEEYYDDNVAHGDQTDKQDTLEIKSMMRKIYQAFKGQSSLAPSSSVTLTLALTNILANVERENVTNTATEEPPSHTEGETKDSTMKIPISSIQPTEVPPTQA